MQLSVSIQKITISELQAFKIASRAAALPSRLLVSIILIKDKAPQRLAVEITSPRVPLILHFWIFIYRNNLNNIRNHRNSFYSF